MAKDRLPWVLRSVYNRPGFAWLAVITLGILFWGLLLAGCATVGRNYNSRYYYVAEIPVWIIEYVEAQAVIEVLAWKDYRNRAGEMGCNVTSIACTEGIAIILLSGATCEQYLESIYHEAGHWRDAIEATGSNRHSGKDWSSSKPYGYDQIVIEKMKSFDFSGCGNQLAVLQGG